QRSGGRRARGLLVPGGHRLRMGPGREAAGRLGRRARHPEHQGGGPPAHPAESLREPERGVGLQPQLRLLPRAALRGARARRRGGRGALDHAARSSRRPVLLKRKSRCVYGPRMTPPRLTPLAAAALLACFFAASVAGMLDTSHHPDESCRIASGYTYLRYGNMRLNPEDPPLGKELAAFPLLFLHLRLPVDLAALRPGNIGRGDSFTFAARLLYEQDIPPETILFFPRLIAVLSATALGALLFAVTRNRWGDAAALIALCFYCLSPTVLANTPIVGLDVLGALGAFGAFWVFLRFLTEPTRTNAIRTGLVVGSVELLKFSLLPLIPYFVLLLVTWCWANWDRVPLQNGLASML